MADDGAAPLPKAIQAQIDAGNAAFKAQGAVLAPVEPPKATPVPTHPMQPAREPVPTHPSPTDITRAPEPQSPPAAEPEAEPPHDPMAAMEARLRQADQAMRTMVGRHRTDMQNASQRLKEAEETIARATQQITDLSMRGIGSNTGNQGAGKNPLTNGPRFANVTDDERREYGEPFLDMVARVAQEAASGVVREQVAPILTQTSQFGDRLDNTAKALEAGKTARRNAWLNANVPGWEIQDNDPMFLEWLREEDGLTGVVRLDILGRAYERDDYPRIKMIFEGYAKELGVIAPSSSNRQPVQPRVRMETLASPNGGNGRVDAIVPSDAPEAPLTEAEIARHFARKIRSPGSYPQAEIDAFEARMARSVATNNYVVTPRL